MLQKTVTIVNNLGLHTRAAAKLVNVAARYGSRIQIQKDGQKVNGKSIMGVMMLAASLGSTIELTIEGEDEREVMDALIDLINSGFGENTPG